MFYRHVQCQVSYSTADWVMLITNIWTRWHVLWKASNYQKIVTHLSLHVQYVAKISRADYHLVMLVLEVKTTRIGAHRHLRSHGGYINGKIKIFATFRWWFLCIIWRYIFVYFLQNKNQALKCFRNFKALAENQKNKK